MITNDNLPLFVELVADATGLGKSFAAWRVRYHCDLAGILNTMVRIETRGVQVKLRKGDVSIAVEDFAQASERPGGIAGVLQPLSAAILAAAKHAAGHCIDACAVRRENLDEMAIGRLSAQHYDFNHRSAKNEAFVKAYNTEFHRNPDFFSVVGYNGMHLIYEALKKDRREG